MLIPRRQPKVPPHLVDHAIAVELGEHAAATDPDHVQVLFQIDLHEM